MLKETVTYTDFNGTERTEDCWFNLSKLDLMQLLNTSESDPTAKLRSALNSADPTAMMLFFKDFMLAAYGERSVDGRRFIKSKEISEAFSQTIAFEELFMRLINDENGLLNFIYGVIPNDLSKAIAADNKMNAAQGVIPMV